MHAIVQNNAVVFGPSHWDPYAFSAALMQLVGLSVSLSVDAPSLVVNLPGIQILPVLEVGKGYDPRIEELVEPPSFTIGTEAVTATYTKQDRPLATVQAEQINALKQRTRAEIMTGAPDYMQWNAALGILSSEDAAAVVAHIEACRAVCNTTEAAINEATTLAGVLAVVAG